MEIQLVDFTTNRGAIEDILEKDGKKDEIIKEMKRSSEISARICYEKGNFEEFRHKKLNEKFVQKLLDRGHHSVFEHINFTFDMINLPKALAMVLNNEKQYATSEKSARYTIMENVVPLQKDKYDKWMGILGHEIEEVYPQMSDVKKRDIAIRKLAQENARYMTSVFTPTMMRHTVNWRQLNFLMQSFNEFAQERQYCAKEFGQRLAPYLEEFSQQISWLKVEGLENQTDRHLSLFSDRKVKEHFGDVYATSYPSSFAGLAQAQRHRTINYHVSEGTEIKAPLEFFIPDIIKDNALLVQKWIEDLTKVSQKDFPQAQLLEVNERGIIEDFRSKALLRMCGHAQYEIMQNTLNTTNKYNQYQEEYKNALKPKCLQGMKCPEPCVWGGKRALERIV